MGTNLAEECKCQNIVTSVANDGDFKMPASLSCNVSCLHFLQLLNFKSHAFDINDENGDSALHVICRMGDGEAAALILKAAPSLSILSNFDGETPLQIAYQ